MKQLSQRMLQQRLQVTDRVRKHMTRSARMLPVDVEQVIPSHSSESRVLTVWMIFSTPVGSFA